MNKLTKIEVNGEIYVREDEQKPLGELRIVVADRGWVFAGRCVDNEDGSVTIYNADNIRRWGTTRGLGELVDGPLPDTVLDPYGTVRTRALAEIRLNSWR